MLIKSIRSKKVKREFVTPDVTLIITAFNEEKRIQEKLENSIVLEYPEGKLQILVASDGSTDGTNDIVRSFEAQGVELLEVVNIAIAVAWWQYLAGRRVVLWEPSER